MFVVAVDLTEDGKCGATYTLRGLLKALAARGHRVQVVVQERPTDGATYDGFPMKWYHYADREWRAADVIVCQHYPCGAFARKLNHTTGANRPIVYVANFGDCTGYLQEEKMKYEEAIVCMSKAMEDAFSRKFAAAAKPPYTLLTVTPPVSFQHYSNVPFFSAQRDKITFINCNVVKGADTFREIARRMPDRQFLVVKGYYQSHFDVSDLSNVEMVEFEPDIRKVFARTRLLLCPSRQESWGRVANEAMCAGIPVLYSEPYRLPGRLLTTEGLACCVGANAGLALPATDVDAWMAGIEKMDDPESYETMSQAAVERAQAIEQENGLPAFVDFMEALARRTPNVALQQAQAQQQKQQAGRLGAMSRPQPPAARPPPPPMPQPARPQPGARPPMPQPGARPMPQPARPQPMPQPARPQPMPQPARPQPQPGGPRPQLVFGRPVMFKRP
jgi:glycosyltransferase involved in cell wall biosynthesis